jgi:hypothetical protein
LAFNPSFILKRSSIILPPTTIRTPITIKAGRAKIRKIA